MTKEEMILKIFENKERGWLSAEQMIALNVKVFNDVKTIEQLREISHIAQNWLDMTDDFRTNGDWDNYDKYWDYGDGLMEFCNLKCRQMRGE